MEIAQTLPAMHPGEMLREEFLLPLGLTPGKVARAAGIPRTRIEHIVGEKTGISADTALRLGRVLGTSPEFWLNLQMRYDLLRATAALRAARVDAEPARGVTPRVYISQSPTGKNSGVAASVHPRP